MSNPIDAMTPAERKQFEIDVIEVVNFACHEIHTIMSTKYPNLGAGGTMMTVVSGMVAAVIRAHVQPDDYAKAVTDVYDFVSDNLGMKDQVQ